MTLCKEFTKSTDPDVCKAQLCNITQRGSQHNFGPGGVIGGGKWGGPQGTEGLYLLLLLLFLSRKVLKVFIYYYKLMSVPKGPGGVPGGVLYITSGRTVNGRARNRHAKTKTQTNKLH